MSCPSCHHPRPGRHWRSCTANRCEKCGKAPRLIGALCGPCWRAQTKERARIVAERLAAMEQRDDE